MSVNLKKQQGSFFAEIGAVIASIAILTLISTSYMDSMAGRAQVSEAFVLMNPIVENVNSFYAMHGVINTNDDADDNPIGNYGHLDVYDNSGNGNNPNDYAGRYVTNVTSYDNGVVMAQMNPQFSDEDYAKQTVGKVSNVQTAIQGEYIFLVPFLIGDTDDGSEPGEQTSLRWACLTTIDANPPTGETIDPLANDTINEQYFYAPGCVVITVKQANCLVPGSGDLNGNDGIASCPTNNQYKTPLNWNTPLVSIVNNTAD